MDQLNLLTGPPRKTDEPEWHDVEIEGRPYRWRLWPERVPIDWRDHKDPRHPNLWYVHPAGAFEAAYLDREPVPPGPPEWKLVRFFGTTNRVWQSAREEALKLIPDMTS